MKVFLIQRAKNAPSPSPLLKQLSDLLGNSNVHVLKASADNMLSLSEHTLRLRRQWLRLLTADDDIHLISSGVECEILKYWHSMYPGDFQSATLINNVGVIKSFSIKSLFYYVMFLWNMIFNKQEVRSKPLLLLGESNKRYKENYLEFSHVPYMKKQSIHDYLEETDPEWIANQVYTWINREKNTL